LPNVGPYIYIRRYNFLLYKELHVCVCVYIYIYIEREREREIEREREREREWPNKMYTQFDMKNITL
jgi:hypothetical protein